MAENENKSGNKMSPEAEKLQNKAEQLQIMIDMLQSQASELQEQASKLNESSEAQKKDEKDSGFQLSRPEGVPAPESTSHHHSSSGSSSRHHSSSGSSSHRYSSSGSGSSHHSSSSGSSSHHHSSSSSGSGSSSHHHSSSSSGSGSSSHHHSSSSSGSGSSSHRHSSSSSSSGSSLHHHSSSGSSYDSSASTGSSSQHHKSSSSKKRKNTKSKFKRINVFKNLRASMKMQSKSSTRKKIRKRKFNMNSSKRSTRKGIKDPNMPQAKSGLGSRWKLVIGAVISALVILIIGGYAAYKTFIIPSVVEPALEQAAKFIANDKYNAALTKEIRRLYQEGQLSGKEVETFLEANDETVAEYIPGAVYKGSPAAAPQGNTSAGSSASAGGSGSAGSSASAGGSEEADSSEEAPERSESSGRASSGSSSPYDPVTGVADTSNKNATETSSLGVNTIKIRDENSTVTGSKYSDTSTTVTESTANTISRAELMTLSGEQLLKKAQEIMSPEDFALAMTLRSKIDAGKLRSLSSNESEAVMYIQSCLTPDEYNNMLMIYAKYSNHLTQ